MVTVNARLVALVFVVSFATTVVTACDATDASASADTKEPDLEWLDGAADASPDGDGEPDATSDGLEIPSGCCQTVTDCADDEVCVRTTDGLGVCLIDLSKLMGRPVPPGSCWWDEDCWQGFTCSEAVVGDCETISSPSCELGSCFLPGTCI